MKKLYEINALPLYTCYFGYTIAINMLFQWEFNIVYGILQLLGLVVTVAIAVVKYVPQDLGPVWVKFSITRKQLLSIKTMESDALDLLPLRGHFRNSTEFFNYCYRPIDQYMDVYVKLPVLDSFYVREKQFTGVVFAYSEKIDLGIVEALRRELNELPLGPDDCILVEYEHKGKPMQIAYPIKIEFRKVPKDYYGWFQSACRILLHVSAQIPDLSFKDIWDACKDTATKLRFWKRG